MKTVMNTIDSTLYNLRPSPSLTLQVTPSQTTYAAASSAPATSQAWGPQMWTMIDKEMTLNDCSVYCYAPDEGFDGEEGAIWSLNYFFFNKGRKRVAYLYVRGIPVMSHSPRIGMTKRSGTGLTNMGANKRAKYWLGDKADAVNTQGAEDDELDDDWNIDDDYDPEDTNDPFDGDEFCDDYDDEADDESDEQNYKGPVRGVSEDIAAEMEIEL